MMRKLRTGISGRTEAVRACAFWVRSSALILGPANVAPFFLLDTWLGVAAAIATLFVINGISLVFDAVDSWRWLRGEREVPGHA